MRNHVEMQTGEPPTMRVPACCVLSRRVTQLSMNPSENMFAACVISKGTLFFSLLSRS